MSEEIILKALSAGGSVGGSGSIPFADEDGSTVASTPGRGQSRIFSKEELIYSDVTPRGEATSRNVANLTSFRNPILKSNTESNVAGKYCTSSNEVGINTKSVSGTRIALKKSRTDSCVPEADNPLQRYENALLKYQKIKVPARKQISRENSYGYSSSDDSVIRNKSKSTSSIDTQSVNNILDEYEDLDYRRSSDISDVGSINVTNFEAVMDQQRQREKSKLRSPMAPAARNAAPPLSEKLQPLLKVNQQTQVRQRSRDRLKDSGRIVPMEETSGAIAVSAGKTSVDAETNKNSGGKVPDLLMRKGEVQKRVDEWLSQTQSQNFVGVKDKVLVRSNSSADYRYRNNSNSRARSVEETGEKLNGTVSYDDLNREGNKGEVKADKVSIGVNTSRGTYKEYLATRSKMKQNDYGFSGSNGTRSTRDMSPGTTSKIPQRGFSNSSFRSKKTELSTEPADSSKITCSFDSRVTRERNKITENRLANQTKSRAEPEPGKATSTIIPSRRPSFKRTQSVNQSAGVLIKEERSPRARPTVSSEKGPTCAERAAQLTGQLGALPNMDGESQRPLLPCEAQVSDADRTDPGKPMEGPYRDERNLKKLTTDSVEAERTVKERVAVRSSCKVQPKIETSSRLDSIYGPVEPPRLRTLHGQVESSNKELENQSQLTPIPRTFHGPNAFEGRKLPAIPRKDQSQTGNENYVKCTIINPVSTFKPNNAMYATLQQPSEHNSFATTIVNESVTRSHYATPKHIEKIYERPQPQVIHADDLESILKPVALPSAYGDKLLANERKVHAANDVGNSRGQKDDEDIYEKISDVRFEQLETIVEDQKSDNDDGRFPEIGLSQCLKVQQKMPNGKVKSSGFTESAGKDTIYAKPWAQTMILNDPPKTFSTFQTHHQDNATRLNHANQSRRTCPVETNESEGLSGKVREQNSEPSEDMQESYDGNSVYEVRSTLRLTREQLGNHSREGSNLSSSTVPLEDLKSDLQREIVTDNRLSSRPVDDVSVDQSRSVLEKKFTEDTVQLANRINRNKSERDPEERENKVSVKEKIDLQPPTVSEILLKTLKFKQDLPIDLPKISEPVLPTKQFNFHNVLSDDYDKILAQDAMRLKESKVYVTKEEMEHQKLMDLLKKGDYDAVKSELERSYTLSTPGGSSPVCCPPCSPPPAPAAYISSARASSRRLGVGNALGGPPSPERDPLGRLLRFLKTFYRELGTRDPPHLPQWALPLPLGTLCPAHFQPHLQLVHKSEQEHLLENIRPEQIFAPVRLSDGTIAEAPRRVAVEGGPGSGRTTLCLRLLHQWATQGDGPALAFIVPLRELRGSPLLNYLARELFPRTAALGDAVAQVWRTLHLIEDRVLFVLDGYDECVGGRASLGDAVDLLEGRLFPDARILVTCSPNNSPTLSPLVQRRIHLAGLEWPHVERLCVAYFIHNDVAERACEFLEALNVQPQAVKQLGQHPLGWIMLCSLYQDSGSLPTETSALVQAAVKCIVKRSLDPPIPYNEEIPGHCRKRLEDFGKLSLAALREGRCCYTEAELRARGGGIEVTRLGFLTRGLTFGQRRKPDLYTPIHMAVAEFLAAYYLTSVAQYANILRRELEGLPPGIISHLAGLLGPKTHLILNQLCPLEVPPRAVFSLLKAAGASDGNISAVCRLVGAGPGFGPAPNERPPSPLVHTVPLELEGWARILKSPACTLEALELVFQIERGSDPRYLDEFFEALAGNESVKLVRITSLLGQESPTEEAQRLAGHLKNVLGKKKLNDFELVITCLEESAHDGLECVVNALCRGLSHASVHLARLVLDMNLSGKQVSRVCEALRDCVQVQALHLPHLSCGCEGLTSVAELLKERPLLALNIAGCWGAKNEDPSSSGISMGSGSGSGSSGCASSTLGTLPLNRCCSSLPRGALAAYGSLTRPATLPRLPFGLGLGPGPVNGTGALPVNDRDRDSNGSSKRNSDSVLCHRVPLLHPLPTCDAPSHQGTGFHEIFNAIREPNCKLRSLNVSKCLVGGLDAECLGETIRKARNLDALRAAGASRPADVMPLVKALMEAPCLQLLDLASSRLALDDNPSRLLCHALVRNGTLRLLSLEGWTFRIEESDSLALFSELLRYTSVRELNLCNARLHLAVHEGPLARLGRRDDAGAELLRAAPPPACPVIVFLRLAGFQVTVNDRLALRGPLLLPFLAGFTALSELDLSLDKSAIGGSSDTLLFIDDKILQQFFGCLSTHFRNLQSLSINFWRISLEDSDKTMRQIAKYLKLCNLSFLRANGLKVTDSAKKVQMEHIFIQTLLTNLQYLTWLCLDGVDLTETQASSVGKCVRDRYPGTNLEISAKDVNVKSVKALVAAIEEGGRAEVLYTGGSNCRLKITKLQKNGRNKKK